MFGEYDYKDEDDDEFFDPENEYLWRCKWVADGATTIAEMAEKLRAEADWLDAMERSGWVLVSPVEDDYGQLERS